MKTRYIVAWIKYQHAIIGDDSYCGWQDFHTTLVFQDKEKAVKHFNYLKSNPSDAKDVFITEEISI